MYWIKKNYLLNIVLLKKFQLIIILSKKIVEGFKRIIGVKL